MQPNTLNYMVGSCISFKLPGYKLGMRIIAGKIFLVSKYGFYQNSSENWLVFQIDGGHMAN